MLDALTLPFVQRGLAEVLLLAVGAGLVGTWVVLRGLAFFSHAVGTAAFPGLVLADGLGFAAPIGALGAAAAFAAVLAALSARRGGERSAETALVLVGMLALGVILASDVFGSSAGLDALLFGSLLLIGAGDLALAALVSVLALAAAATLGRRWVAAGFDGEGERSALARSPLLDLALLVLTAVATAAALGTLGALLVAALFVVPAATTRLWTREMRSWQLATVALAAGEGVVGVLVSVELNAPPGATIAVLASAVFALAGLWSAAGQAARARARVAVGAVLAALLLGSCGSNADGPVVVATTPLAADLVGEVGGDEVEVRRLLAPNTDPHDYEPRPDDIEAIAGAELVVASGGGLDAWIASVIEESGSDARLLVLGDLVPRPLRGERGEETDPHWWHDPRNVASLAVPIGDALAPLAPQAEDALQESAADLARRVRQLDQRIAACIESIPPADRKLVTDHDSFGYFAERYDLEIVGAVIPALTSQAEPSAGELAELRELIEREDVPAVFPESAGSGELAQAIARETGASADYQLYGDSLGPPGSGAETYLEMQAANAEAVVRGLSSGERGCAVP